jgi:hypothetical protein
MNTRPPNRPSAPTTISEMTVPSDADRLEPSTAAVPPTVDAQPEIDTSEPNATPRPPPTFTTDDLPVAAYLRVLGYPLLDVQREAAGRVTFQFEDRQSRVRDLSDYYADTTQVSPRRFGEALGSLIASCDIARLLATVRRAS